MKPYTEIPIERRKRALYSVLRSAILHARMVAGGGHPAGPNSAVEALQEIECLMDAIHNIPIFLMDDLHGWNDELFRNWSLGRYDYHWSKRRGLALGPAYEKALHTNPEFEALMAELIWESCYDDD